MAMLTNVEEAWETSVVAAAGEIDNDETTSSPGTNESHDIKGVDEVTIRVKALALVAATSVDLYPQVADSANEWAYCTYTGGAPVIINVDWDAVRESRALPAIPVRGQKFRILVGSTGTAGNETISVDIMRHKYIDVI